MWGSEWAVNRVLDVVVPPAGLLLLAVWAPVLLALNAFAQLYHWIRHPSLGGKTVLITGASSGIGEYLAYEFARRGAKLVLAAQRGERLRQVAKRCEDLGAEDCVHVEADVTHEPECRRIVEHAISTFGRLDVLVNNAGISPAFLFKDTASMDALRQVMDVDFFGAVWTTLHALPYLRRTGGSILVNVSVSAFLPMPRHAIYTAAKGALLQFFETLRVEPAGWDVGVTLGFPGITRSELTAGKLLDEGGEMSVDTERRDLLVGPYPMLRTETVAARLVQGLLSRSRYVFVPMWGLLPALFRALVPDLLGQSLRWGVTPWVPGGRAPHKLFMEAVGGPQLFYHPPATTQADAEEAVYRGRTKAGEAPESADAGVKGAGAGDAPVKAGEEAKKGIKAQSKKKGGKERMS